MLVSTAIARATVPTTISVCRLWRRRWRRVSAWLVVSTAGGAVSRARHVPMTWPTGISVWHPTPVVVRLCWTAGRLRILPSRVTRPVALLRKRVRLMFCHLLRFVAIQPIEALCFRELVDFGGGDGSKDFLDERRSRKPWNVLWTMPMRTFILPWDTCSPDARRWAS